MYIISHFCFHLPSLSKKYHFLVCYLYIFFSNIFIQVLCPFFNWVAFFLIVKSSLYILNINPISNISFANNFLISGFCFHSLDSAFPKKFLILINSNLLIVIAIFFFHGPRLVVFNHHQIRGHIEFSAVFLFHGIL